MIQLHITLPVTLQSLFQIHWHTRSAADKFAEDDASILWLVPYWCLLSLLNLITAYLESLIDSLNGIPGDVDNVKMDERSLP